jgi:hypothetical protein
MREPSRGRGAWTEQEEPFDAAQGKEGYGNHE